MKQSILCRLIPIVICLITIPLGLGALQSISQKPHQIEPPQARLTKDDAPFKGTDLEPFDMESATTAEIVLKAFKEGYPAKISYIRVPLKVYPQFL